MTHKTSQNSKAEVQPCTPTGRVLASRREHLRYLAAHQGRRGNQRRLTMHNNARAVTASRVAARFLQLVATLAVVAVLAAAAGVSAGPAAAANANSGVYAIAPPWGGYCMGTGNYATYVFYINFTTGQQGGDSGDDIVWLPVANGVRNTVEIGRRKFRR
jgi:hypothetical protein